MSTTTSINLRDPNEPDSCIGGVYSDCNHSPVTNTSIYSGSVENQLFFINSNGNTDWTNLQPTNRCAVSIDGSINSCIISVDGSVTACALSPSDEGSELHVIKTPTPGSPEMVSSIKIFDSTLFPIRSICFGMNGKLRTRIFAGTDEGRIFAVSLSGKSASREFKTSTPHGGVKCVRTCPLTGNLAASYCDGYVVLFDSNGAEMENKKICKKTMTPDSVEKFFIDWNPKSKERVLVVSGQAKPVFLKSGVWATTPVDLETPASAIVNGDGILSIAKWNLDGTMVAGITNTGTVLVYDYSGATGADLKIRALSGSNVLVNLAWSFDSNIASHVVNGIGLKGTRTCISANDAPFLKRELKIDINSLLGSSKEAAIGNMESGLEEAGETEDTKMIESAAEEANNDSDSSSSSGSSSSEAESVDESPEQLADELNDLIDNGEEKEKQEADNVTGDDEEDDNKKSGGAYNREGDYESSRSTNRNLQVDRQFTFQPGATVGAKAGRKGVTRRILCWNQFGSVVRTDFPIAADISGGGEKSENQEGLIEVHLELDNAPMKQFRLKDNLHGWAMASLGDAGLALAVKSRFDITDKYEDDMLEDDTVAEEAKKKKREIDELTGGLSKVCYRPFTSWGNQREWIVPLPLKAEVESIAVGSSCVAAIATDSTIRVWSNEGGFLLHSWTMKASIPISICGNGEIFFAVSAMKSRSTETLFYETFLTQNSGGRLTLVDSGPLPITGTPGTALCWTGISEDFVPFTCDTQGLIRGLFPFNCNTGADSSGYSIGGECNKFLWIPLLNFVNDYQRRGEGYWPIFVSERDIWCVPTRAEDEYEPRPAPLPPTIKVPLRPQGQYIADKNEPLSAENQLMLDRLITSQMRFCAQLGLAASAFKTATDGDVSKITKKAENLHDKKLADTFRKLLEAGKLEKALGGAALAFQSMTSRLMIRMAAALGMRALEARLEDLFNPTQVYQAPAGGGSVAAAPATVHHQQQSAAASLFPQAGGSVGRPIVPTVPSPQETTTSTPGNPQVSTSGPVNPFAKKRKDQASVEENDNGNKLARNA